MRIVIAAVAKQRRFGRKGRLAAMADRIDRIAGSPPWSVGPVRHESWTSQSRVVRVDTLSNEPETARPLLLRHGAARVAAWTGYIDDPGSVLNTANVGDAAARLAGCFALVSASTEGAAGATSVHRMETLYVAEGQEFYVLSSSARVAQQAAGLEDSAAPLEALIGLAGPGFMLSSVTPFAGVEAVPADTYVELTPDGMRLKPVPAPDIDPSAPLDVVAEHVGSYLVDAAKLVGSELPCTAHLTAGRDSRLAAAALAAAGVDFAGVTSGTDQHPDVVYGRQVASVLGVPHVVNPPSDTLPSGDAIEVAPLERAFNVLRGCEGMLTAYEKVSIHSTFRDDAVVVGGHGGELLRGGFGYLVPNGTSAAARRRLEMRAAPHRALLRAEASEELDRVLAPWMELADNDPHRSLERFYRELRIGRWHAVYRFANSIAGSARSILADNRAVRVASAVPQRIAAEERLFHAILHSMDPNLCKVPLFPKRWNFEKDGPSEDCNPHEWADREPPEGGSGSAWNWRVSYPTQMHDHLSEVILSAPLYDSMLEFGGVEQLMSDTRSTRTGAEAKLIWSLYTVSLYVSGLASRTEAPTGPRFRIPLPGTP